MPSAALHLHKTLFSRVLHGLRGFPGTAAVAGLCEAAHSGDGTTSSRAPRLSRICLHNRAGEGGRRVAAPVACRRSRASAPGRCRRRSGCPRRRRADSAAERRPVRPRSCATRRDDAARRTVSAVDARARVLRRDYGGRSLGFARGLLGRPRRRRPGPEPSSSSGRHPWPADFAGAGLRPPHRRLRRVESCLDLGDARRQFVGQGAGADRGRDRADPARRFGATAA